MRAALFPAVLLVVLLLLSNAAEARERLPDGRQCAKETNVDKLFPKRAACNWWSTPKPKKDTRDVRKR